MSYPAFAAVERILAWMQQNPLALPDAFARVIEAERERQRLSRAALAAKDELHQAYVGLMERGKRGQRSPPGRFTGFQMSFPRLIQR